jgi:hypothetical protein
MNLAKAALLVAMLLAIVTVSWAVVRLQPAETTTPATNPAP